MLIVTGVLNALLGMARSPCMVIWQAPLAYKIESILTRHEIDESIDVETDGVVPTMAMVSRIAEQRQLAN